MIKSLRKKFILITMTLITVVLVTVFVGIYIYSSSNLKHESYLMLEKSTENRPGKNPPRFKIGDDSPPEGFTINPILRVTVLEDGTMVWNSEEGFSVDEEQLQIIVDLALESKDNRGELADFSLRFAKRIDRSQIKLAFSSTTLEDEQNRSMLYIILLAAAASLIIFFFISLLLSRWALKPVELAWKQQKQFISDASHELKTPLTVILANVGILKGHKDDTIKNQINWLESTEMEAERMKDLTNSLLFLAKSDDSATRTEMAPMNFSLTAETSALSFESVAFEKGLSLNTDIHPDIYINANLAQIKQLVGIFLDNAVKYGATSSVVTITLKQSQGFATLSVHNYGTPISQKEREHIFDRFYRVDQSRAESGYGLGLSIAKAIAEQHSGKIGLETTGNGNTFWVAFPVHRST